MLLLLGLAIPRAALASLDYLPSAWASLKVNIAQKAGLLPKDFDNQPFTDYITRQDFCELLVNSCRIFGYPLPVIDAPVFTDTKDNIAAQALKLGLTSGTGQGLFSPDLPLTREMAVGMLGRLRTLLQPDQELIDEQKADRILTEYSSDSAKLSAWAKRSMADAYMRGIITGTSMGVLSPQDNVTREQAAILTLNTLTYCDDTLLNAAGITECVLPSPSGIYIRQSYENSNVNLLWGEIPNAAAYEVRIFKNDTLAYSARVKNNTLDLSAHPDIFAHEKTTVRALLEVVPADKNGRLSLFSLRREFTVSPDISRRTGAIVSRAGFKSAAEALSFMTSIEVPVWQLSEGTKKPAVITLTVHKDVAEDVKSIFQEIFNGSEKFPIKSCYGYSFRGTSQHSSGLAIDINPDENYFLGRDGTIKAGKLWKPGENPYSIPPDGDVVRAFKKYGWHWSPEMHWSSGADYMHFSLFGT